MCQQFTTQVESHTVSRDPEITPTHKDTPSTPFHTITSHRHG